MRVVVPDRYYKARMGLTMLEQKHHRIPQEKASSFFDRSAYFQYLEPLIIPISFSSLYFSNDAIRFAIPETSANPPGIQKMSFRFGFLVCNKNAEKELILFFIVSIDCNASMLQIGNALHTCVTARAIIYIPY